MADDFFLDETAYDAIMTDLQSTGQKIGESYQLLTDVLLEYDGAWGGDDIGKAFEKKYLGDSDDSGARGDLKAFDGVEDNIKEVADIGKKNAKTFAGLDHDTAQRLDLQ
ncbi:hypothetical protein [Amycolatopsis minnesotensis]|uniref:WXG100 family type VII secretion target n=1 Tax=Amycolatopsis minnesotensis TaxID=337894 RepID=A0ABN2S7U2_9PSEU